jgi:hypothetical protein
MEASNRCATRSIAGPAAAPLDLCSLAGNVLRASTNVKQRHFDQATTGEPLQTTCTSPRNYLKIHQREIRINTRNTDAAAFTLFRFVPRE